MVNKPKAVAGPFANIFEQAAQICKAHGYDILAEQVGELKAENEKLKSVNGEMIEALRGVQNIFNNEANYPPGTVGYRLNEKIAAALTKATNIKH